MGDLFTGLNLPIIHMTEIEIYLLSYLPWYEEGPVAFVLLTACNYDSQVR
jgi:hypothetical protein